ncbi:hypothetical protein, partial [Klebsiella quasivariicola]|uniref:hypothetical protein n=1 Tax=Klebsiella quasivariicola TaxID=2026240 RepID=UPI001CCC48F8
RAGFFASVACEDGNLRGQRFDLRSVGPRKRSAAGHHHCATGKYPSESQKSSLPQFPAVCSLFCDIFHCIFLSMNRSFFAKLMAQYSIFRCAF